MGKEPQPDNRVKEIRVDLPMEIYKLLQVKAIMDETDADSIITEALKTLFKHRQ